MVCVEMAQDFQYGKFISDLNVCAKKGMLVCPTAAMSLFTLLDFLQLLGPCLASCRHWPVSQAHMQV